MKQFYLVLILILVAGCSRNTPSDLPRLYPVLITVIQDGKPMEGASVLLTSQEKSASKYNTSSAVTDVSGNAKILTYGFPGTPLGTYKVTVTKLTVEGTVKTVDALGTPRETGGQAFQLVEAKYTQTETTPLEITVTKKNTLQTIDVGNKTHAPAASMPK